MAYYENEECSGCDEYDCVYCNVCDCVGECLNNCKDKESKNDEKMLLMTSSETYRKTMNFLNNKNKQHGEFYNPRNHFY
ncbi:uncharacterized protein VNE69_04094 [Vairimorpha necatrix]|uniref:Uncharacterized protein n=1 Tax=Vairimorpha necatrix TaxID=6039 RepID=A0AAX4JBF6_9MICR